MSRVDQILAGYDLGDAISREARSFRDTFREMGFESDIFAPPQHIAETVTDDALPLGAYVDNKENVLLYHFSIGSESSALYSQAQARRLVRYHNITPSHYFAGYDDDMVRRLDDGREELKRVVADADLVLADSRFNADEATAVGGKAVEVMELVSDLDEVEPDERKIDRYYNGLSNILFVGRIVPNKGIEDLITAFRWINKAIDSKSRLILVGSERSCPAYYAMLKMLADDLELDNVCFEGFLNEAELSACYCCADVFVTASHHEGYCMPLIEAMKYEVPVVARDCGGMVDAMGGAGVMFDDLDPVLLGELVAKVMWDDDLASRVLASQEERIERIKGRNLLDEWSKIL